MVPHINKSRVIYLIFIIYQSTGKNPRLCPSVNPVYIQRKTVRESINNRTICILFCKSWARVMRQSHGTFRLHYDDLHLSSEKKNCVHNGNRQHWKFAFLGRKYPSKSKRYPFYTYLHFCTCFVSISTVIKLSAFPNYVPRFICFNFLNMLLFVAILP